jgi:adenine-specific DNA-methyltransferase
MSKQAPATEFKWMQVIQRDSGAILKALQTGRTSAAVRCLRRDTVEAVTTGLSRPPRTAPAGVPLHRFASVVRGIATGANEFFFLTREQLRSFGLSESLFLRAIGRTRDCQAGTLTAADVEKLDAAGRPTWLLNLSPADAMLMPPPLRAYLERGEVAGLPQRALIRTRRPWFKMERRMPPPILFAYLGRRDCRFILNEAGVVPLTGFLCVYPHAPGMPAARKLCKALNAPETIANLAATGKSYGGGAVKVEPRQLDNLEIPLSALRAADLALPQVAVEGRLFDE